MDDNRNQQQSEEQRTDSSDRDTQRGQQQEVGSQPQPDAQRDERGNESPDSENTRGHMSHYASSGEGDGGGGSLY